MSSRHRNRSNYKDCSVVRPVYAVTCLTLAILPVVIWTTVFLHDPSHDSLNFIPSRAPRSYQQQQHKESHLKCSQLFKGTSAENFDISQLSKTSAKHLEKHLQHDNASNYDRINEAPELYRTLQYIVLQSKARRACIAGFNLGQAALHILTVSRKILVYAFRRPSASKQSQKVEAELRKRFNNRLHVYDGDTAQTIPRFILTNHHRARCDVMIINGPIGYQEAKLDINNLVKLARRGNNNFIFYVDYSTGGAKVGPSSGENTSLAGDGFKETLKAWDESCSSGMIFERLHCEFDTLSQQTSYNPYRGFAIGTVRSESEATGGITAGRKGRSGVKSPETLYGMGVSNKTDYSHNFLVNEIKVRKQNTTTPRPSIDIVQMGKYIGPLASVNTITPPLDRRPRISSQPFQNYNSRSHSMLISKPSSLANYRNRSHLLENQRTRSRQKMGSFRMRNVSVSSRSESSRRKSLVHEHRNSAVSEGNRTVDHKRLPGRIRNRTELKKTKTATRRTFSQVKLD